jgi:hypothetical protein
MQEGVPDEPGKRLLKDSTVMWVSVGGRVVDGLGEELTFGGEEGGSSGTLRSNERTRGRRQR